MTKYDRTLLRKRARILYVDDNTLYSQIGNRLCTSDDNGISWRKYPVKLVGGAFAYSRIHARITRNGVHCAKKLTGGNILLVAKRGIYVYDQEENKSIKSFSIPRGSRPLFICENQNGDLFWGEYFGNAKRDEVNIYKSKDRAKSWEIIYKFEKNGIRHVHGVFYDPYDDRIWLTTGDDDEESAIWVTNNQFNTLEKVLSGSQQCRATQLVFTNDYIYFGTDTPFEINHIYRLDKSAGKAEKVATVESSIYWGCKVGDCLFFSTAVEPSSLNPYNFAVIWASLEGSRWVQIAKYQKDFWPMKYCQIGQIYLPQGNNTTGYLFYTPIATESDQTLQRIKIDDLFH